MGLCLQNHSSTFTFCHQNLRLLLAFRPQNGFSFLTLRLHLFFHGRLYIRRWNNILNFHAIDLDAPRIRGLIQDGPHLTIDDISGGEGSVQLQISDDITKCRSRQIRNSHHRPFHTIRIRLGVCDLEKDYRINLDRRIVFRDHRLRWKIRDLLFQIHLHGYRINKWNLPVKSCTPCGTIRSQTLNDIRACLRYDSDIGDQDDQYQQDDTQ